MTFRVEVQFEPIHELINSLHTYICRSSHKKIDLSSSWATSAKKLLAPEFANMLDETDVDADWKLMYLLVHLCPDKTEVSSFISWLENLTLGELYDMIAEYSTYLPENMGKFHSKSLVLFGQWNELYFKNIRPEILTSLHQEKKSRLDKLLEMNSELFIDSTTNGLMFKPISGLEEIILIPQFHFQPISVIYHYGKFTICSYSARIYFADHDENISPQNYRMLRSVGEKSRLKILRYLNKGPRSFIEIVRYLKLSKGITHDHISNLRRAGLIYAHFEGEALTEYSLRPSGLEEMQKNLLEYITEY
ncbi:ArsR family transcriptional regulator [Paenibacillus zeisoli]|uniref:ArsR family transcriptional regulator n=1 Tax=Paenibacillus zeisoli TaxID=2496267 RepID=A0A433XP59_9BACL|nr:winged helix-turn-helix domain-containing protein [Paenibacillus zeisoli]RUT35882.1 ArsR family transcriptional regulator [Paenibacillus zeisoli]